MVELYESYRDFTDLPPLSDDELKNPFSKFYYVPVELPAPEVLEAIAVGARMDPSKALAITDITTMFAPGYHECENGYCLMPDGTGYSAVKIDLPNVTLDELMYLMEYGHENNIQYKTWLPKMHLQQGQFTIENLGWEPLIFHQRLAMQDPSHEVSDRTLGIADPRALDPDFIALVGGSLFTIDVLSGNRTDITMVTYIRHHGAGIELRVRVWYGLHLIAGEPVRTIPDQDVFPIDKVCATVTHNAFEWTRANTIARDVFALKQQLDAGSTAATASDGSSAPALDQSLEGTYKALMKTPAGEQEMTFVYHVEDDRLTGTVSAAGHESDIADGRATADGFTHGFTMKMPMGSVKVTVTGTLEPGKIVGRLKTMMGTIPFEGQRV